MCIRDSLYYWDEDDWTEYQVKVIGEDPLADLALLEVIGLERKVPYLEFTNSEDIYTGLNICFWTPYGDGMESIKRYYF